MRNINQQELVWARQKHQNRLSDGAQTFLGLPQLPLFNANEVITYMEIVV